MSPIVHGLEKNYSDEISFIYLDALDPKTEQLRNMIGYRNYPSYFLLDGDGHVITQWVGKVNSSEFTDVIDVFLNSN